MNAEISDIRGSCGEDFVAVEIKYPMACWGNGLARKVQEFFRWFPFFFDGYPKADIILMQDQRPKVGDLVEIEVKLD